MRKGLEETQNKPKTWLWMRNMQNTLERGYIAWSTRRSNANCHIFSKEGTFTSWNISSYNSATRIFIPSKEATLFIHFKGIHCYVKIEVTHTRIMPNDLGNNLKLTHYHNQIPHLVIAAFLMKQHKQLCTLSIWLHCGSQPNNALWQLFNTMVTELGAKQVIWMATRAEFMAIWGTS